MMMIIESSSGGTRSTLAHHPFIVQPAFPSITQAISPHLFIFCHPANTVRQNAEQDGRHHNGGRYVLDWLRQ